LRQWEQSDALCKRQFSKVAAQSQLGRRRSPLGRVGEQYGSLDGCICGFTGGRQVAGDWETQEQAPATSAMLDGMSRELKQFGFKFVGSTIVYSYLQAIGVVNDHIKSCAFRNGGDPVCLK